MKDRLQKLMVAAWEFAKECINTNPQEVRDWKYLYNLRQQLCDTITNKNDYVLIRTITNAVLEWYESIRREEQ